MAVTIDDVRHIATLARLGLTDARAAAIVAELNTIIGHMDICNHIKIISKPSSAAFPNSLSI